MFIIFCVRFGLYYANRLTLKWLTAATAEIEEKNSKENFGCQSQG